MDNFACLLLRVTVGSWKRRSDFLCWGKKIEIVGLILNNFYSGRVVKKWQDENSLVFPFLKKMRERARSFDREIFFSFVSRT